MTYEWENARLRAENDRLSRELRMVEEDLGDALRRLAQIKEIAR